jgi:hypothetical protein
MDKNRATFLAIFMPAVATFVPGGFVLLSAFAAYPSHYLLVN